MIETEQGTPTRLRFRDPKGASLLVEVRAVRFVGRHGDIDSCRLRFRVEYEEYLRIVRDALFNLQPEARGSQPVENFSPDAGGITMEVTLQPTLLADLVTDAETEEEARTYLTELDERDPENPLLHAQNWFALVIEQPETADEVGYRTLWSYLPPTALVSDGLPDEHQLTEAITAFLDEGEVREWDQLNLSRAEKQGLVEDVIGLIFREGVPASTASEESSATGEATLVDLIRDVSQTQQESASTGSLFSSVVDFFEDAGWHYEQITGEPVLSIPFRGEQGEWNCYATVREPEQQFVFYSVLPRSVPEARRQAVAEFLTRANFGMIIGNFEMDFSDGEVRYKTSFDAEHADLRPEVFNQLISVNVVTMDRYLPGIVRVIAGDASPAEAIRAVEGG